MARQRLDVAQALASGLASCGVASLRFDKRGVGMSGGEHLTASLSDETADAGWARIASRERPETTGRVAVIGHSTGAEPTAGGRSRPAARCDQRDCAGAPPGPACAMVREYMAYDPAVDLVATSRPVLAVTGRKDVQVDAADVAAIGRMVTGPFEGETPDDLTHVLRRDQHPPGLHRYAVLLRAPVDPELVERVAAWTKAPS